MEKIYETGKDQHVASYIVYGHTDGKVYADAEHEKLSPRQSWLTLSSWAA